MSTIATHMYTTCLKSRAPQRVGVCCGSHTLASNSLPIEVSCQLICYSNISIIKLLGSQKDICKYGQMMACARRKECMRVFAWLVGEPLT